MKSTIILLMKNTFLHYRISITFSAVIFSVLFLYSCGTPQPFYQSGSASKPDSLKTKKVAYEIFLIGDTGDPVLYGQDPVLQTLQYQLDQASDSSTIVFLGDNIYPDGMNPDTTIEAEREDQAILSRTMSVLDYYSGNAFFVPGNHDWRYGVRGIQAQERFIERNSSSDVQFVPNNACPGPNGFELGNNWYLITLDSQWWIDLSFELTTDVEGCEFSTRTEVMNQVADLAEEHDDKHILLAFHHSLYSNGSHGGFYTFRDYLFPLTNLKEWAYIPLPLISPIYPIYRKLGRSPQDINHQQYEEFHREIREAVEDIENVFFAGGHEHSLGFYQQEKVDENKEGMDYFILSGSGSKESYARTGYGAEFVYSNKGFGKLVSYENGSVHVEFWTPDKESRQGNLVYHKQLIAPEKESTVEEQIALRRKSYESTKDTVKTLQPGPGYAGNSLHRFVWGDHYRDAWTTEVQVPVFDLDTKKGGLKVLDVTGGEQTVTIIVQDSSDNRYVMRSVQKNPKKSLPEVLQETFVTDLAQDQTSASHPFGAMIVPTLSDAAGVYSTQPEYGFISEKSGIEMDVGDREGALVLFEEFVSKNWFNRQYNKDAVDMIDSDELWERMRQQGHAKVDKHQLVRSRIFDIFLGDWDRHEGQWFWAEIDQDSVSVYEPIPIDRDNAFFKSDGVIPWLGRRKWALRKFQLFDEDIRDMAGLNFNARFFDRWFMNELPKEEWITIAEEMQQALSDSVINEAISQWPEPIQQNNGETFRKKLMKRRDKLVDFATRYYDILSEEVNVYGSDQPDRFTVERSLDGQTTVVVYEKGDEVPKSAQKQIYARTFKSGETDEIRLFGFGENDDFDIVGNSDKALTVRIIGGEGRDVINDKSRVAGRSEETLVYDTDYGSTIISSGEVASKTSSDPRINRFDNRAFEYNYVAPLLTAGYNSDDGIFLGGGALIQTHAFRKDPYAARHRITAKRALRTSSFSIKYDGILNEEVGPFDLQLGAEILAPDFVSNYFGQGNETELSAEDYSFYDYKIDNVNLSAGIAEDLENLVFLNADIGYKYFKPLSTTDNFVDSPQSNLTEDDFKQHHYGSLGVGLRVSTVDDEMIPHYGVYFKASTELNVGLNNRSETFNHLSSTMKVYYTLENITTTIASRVGFNTNIGNYNFFQANTIGGQKVFSGDGNLRGYARKRFAGRTSVYHNTELRTKLGDFSSYLFPAKFGVTAFFDQGRVWATNERSRLWHVGYGGGVWISPLDLFVINANYAMSKEDEFVSLSLGFTF